MGTTEHQKKKKKLNKLNCCIIYRRPSFNMYYSSWFNYLYSDMKLVEFLLYITYICLDRSLHLNWPVNIHLCMNFEFVTELDAQISLEFNGRWERNVHIS